MGHQSPDLTNIPKTAWVPEGFFWGSPIPGHAMWCATKYVCCFTTPLTVYYIYIYVYVYMYMYLYMCVYILNPGKIGVMFTNLVFPRYGAPSCILWVISQRKIPVDIPLLWLKPSPSHHHSDRWYVDDSQSWVVNMALFYPHGFIQK